MAGVDLGVVSGDGVSAAKGSRWARSAGEGAAGTGSTRVCSCVSLVLLGVGEDSLFEVSVDQKNMPEPPFSVETCCGGSWAILKNSAKSFDRSLLYCIVDDLVRWYLRLGNPEKLPVGVGREWWDPGKC